MEEARACEGKLKCFEGFQFPYDQIPFQSKVVIYASGMVGQAFYGQLKASKYAKLVLWVDQNWEQADPEWGVTKIGKIRNVQYDYVIIAIDSEKTASEIRENLIQMNVPENKIVWEEYRKRQNSQ